MKLAECGTLTHGKNRECSHTVALPGIGRPKRTSLWLWERPGPEVENMRCMSPEVFG